AWVFRDVLELPDELYGAAAVLEDLGADPERRWGGARAELAAGELELPPGSAAARSTGTPVEGHDVVVHDARRQEAPADTPDEAEPADASPRAQVIAVLPPRGRLVTGRTEFDTLVTTDAVKSVEFFLNGEAAGVDERAPFSATLDLGPEVRPHTVRVVARDRSGLALGDHSVQVNPGSGERFSIRITALGPAPRNPESEPGSAGEAQGGGHGEVQVEARVSLPPGGALERVEVYRNDTLVATLAEPPFRARLPAGGGTQDAADFARVVAVLEDGSQAEDVRFLGTGAVAERVEVNLVELFAVVTGSEDQPVAGLGPEDFEILLDGEPQPVERFLLADEVPLTLGLAIDTSGSMLALMIDAKQAAARFLVNTLIPRDRALLVAFSDRPRVIAEPTGEVSTLLERFGNLHATGATALYDSIVFTLVQLRDSATDLETSRRAVVLLTDGEDQGSRFSTRRVIDGARAEASPVYVISLAGLYNERGSVRKPDLEAITQHTGGRVYYIADVEDLGDAYTQINRELRTQYFMTIATDRPLTQDEVRSIEVRATRPGHRVRFTVGPQR
ncbi:MAG: VWA domain-containing protein, partial [Thermoanaerobaculia bacterium]